MDINEIKTIMINKAINRYNQQLIGFVPDYTDLIVCVYGLNVYVNKEILNNTQLLNVENLINKIKYGK